MDDVRALSSALGKALSSQGRSANAEDLAGVTLMNLLAAGWQLTRMPRPAQRPAPTKHGERLGEERWRDR